MTAQKLVDFNEKKCRIGIVTSPIEKASVAPISNLIEILKPLSKSIVIITGNAGYDFFFKKDTGVLIYDNSHPIDKNCVKKIINYLNAQFRSSLIILKQRNKVDIWIFFMGGERQFIPILIAKLLKKPTLLILTGSIVKTAIYSRDLFVIPIKILNRITCTLVSGILLYSSRLIPETGLDKHKQKVFIAQRHFVDFDLFHSFKNYDDRPDMIGYIGRLSEEKGVINFVKSFSSIIKRYPNIQFFIAGDGILHQELISLISESGLTEKVTFYGWISHDKLPAYLNELKLLVLPSYTEGLPNIMLEAMACGTPVLVTPVGAIRDVIQDEETGFILNDNSPESITINVIRAINHTKLKIIAQNGKQIVESKYSLENAIKSYKKILSAFSRYD